MVFPFLQLPVEIRDCIYKLVLASPEPIVLRPQKRQQRRRSTLRSGRALRPTEEQDDLKVLEGRSQLAILFTCRQIYNEAVPNYYRMNTFYTEDCKILKGFINSIGEECRNEVTSMDLSQCMSGRVLELLPQLTSLRELHLNYYACKFGACPFTLCYTMENLEVVTLAPYCGWDEEGRQFLEDSIKGTLAMEATFRKIFAELAKLKKIKMWGSTA